MNNKNLNYFNGAWEHQENIKQCDISYNMLYSSGCVVNDRAKAKLMCYGCYAIKQQDEFCPHSHTTLVDTHWTTKHTWGKLHPARVQTAQAPAKACLDTVFQYRYECIVLTFIQCDRQKII